MRILVEFTIPSSTGNEVVRSGKVGKVFEQLVEEFHPEAMYMFPKDGERAGLMVIESDDPGLDVQIGERLWFGLNAKVTVTPCMSGEDLGKALASIEQIIRRYG
jgi:hypothetical protein